MEQISNLPDKEFNIMIIKIPTDLERKMNDHSENFNKELENIKMNQSGLKNTITKIKNTLEKINGRLDDTEKWIGNLEDRVVEITETKQKTEKM